MQSALDQFHTNLSRVRNLGSIVDTLESQTLEPLDLSDILRAELVLSVSALDHYVYEVVRLGMLEAYRGRRNRTPRFLAFAVSLSSVLEALSEHDGEAWLDNQIRTRNGYSSFQTPKNIASAIHLVSDVGLWDRVAHNMGTHSRHVRETLGVIVDRRNKIAHEADMDPYAYDERSPIDRQMVTESVDFIEQVVESIHAVIA